MNIYVVLEDVDYENWEIQKIFNLLSKAKKYIEKQNKYHKKENWEKVEDKKDKDVYLYFNGTDNKYIIQKHKVEE